MFGMPSSPLLDREILNLLGADEDYEVFASALRRLCAGDDPPLREAAAVWRLAAPIDAWFLLGRSVKARDLERLAEAARTVLPRPDPRYELPDEDRWLANLRGKERSHSSWLREGLAISLAVVAQHGEILGLSPAGGTPRSWAASVVRSILASVQGWQGWASVSDVLPLLGEAAPDEVLDALNRFLTEAEEVRSLLSDGGDRHFGGECRHAGILWTLERLAWHPAHLARCCAVLARLDAVDPGGRWANRPLGSLVDILFGIDDPYTFADADGLLAAMDAAYAAASETGWRLLLAAYAPLRGRLVRDPPAILAAKPDGWRQLSRDDVKRIVDGIDARLALLIQSANENRIVAALERVESLPAAAQAALAGWLNDAALTPPVNGEDAVWHAVRAALNRNTSFHRDGRDLAEGLEDALRSANNRMTPSDPRARAAWLFRQVPVLSDGESDDWREHQKRLDGLRAAVVKDLADLLAAEELVAFGVGLEAGGAFGIALAELGSNEDEKFVRAMLDLARSEQAGIPNLLLGYCDRRWRREGSEWLDRWLAVAAHAPNAPAAAASLFTILPREGATWRRVESDGADVERLYWRWVWPVLDEHVPLDDKTHAIDRLLAADRVDDALHLAIERARTPMPGSVLVQVADAILRMLTVPDASRRNNLTWELDELFTRLDEAGDVARAELARLEWSFLPILVHTRRGVRTLGEILAEEPETFADLVSWVYRAQPEGAASVATRPEPTVAERNRAELALQLLEHWHGPLPGMTDSGLDGTTLLHWVQQAHQRCHALGRGDIGDVKIGNLLAYAPIDPHDGAWPRRAVRAVLDTLCATKIDNGFITGVHNKRGVTVRNPLDGGAQERDLAAQYDSWAAVSRSSSPHTARLLREIAEGYRADAQREDDQARLNDLR